MRESDLHDAWRALTADMKPNMAITLGMGLPTSAAQLNRDATHFFNTIQKKAWGPRWFDHPQRHLIRAVGFHEHPETNRHIHLAAHVPYRIAERLILDGCRIWKSIRPAGDYFAERIEDVERYGSYITKDAWSTASRDDIFIYASRKR
ncbi:hypothetical protein D3C72_472010 [compost metagenome]